MRGGIQKTIGDVSSEDCSRVGAAAKTDGEAHDIATEDGGKKQGGEQAARVTLRGGCEIDLGARAVHHHAPFGDAHKMGQEIGKKNGKELSCRDAGEGGTQWGERKIIKEHTQDQNSGAPAQERKDPTGLLLVVGANHLRRIRGCLPAMMRLQRDL
ncbi:MAG: hypothetical protein PVS2B2_06770 [Candidatus Acidiferrum sp.]